MWIIHFLHGDCPFRHNLTNFHYLPFIWFRESHDSSSISTLFPYLRFFLPLHRLFKCRISDCKFLSICKKRKKERKKMWNFGSAIFLIIALRKFLTGWFNVRYFKYCLYLGEMSRNTGCGWVEWDKVALGDFFPSRWDLMDCVGVLSGIKWR